MDEWICEICAEEFKNEIDLLAHQFNSQCEKDMNRRQRAKETKEKNPQAENSRV